MDPSKCDLFKHGLLTLNLLSNIALRLHTAKKPSSTFITPNKYSRWPVNVVLNTSATLFSAFASFPYNSSLIVAGYTRSCITVVNIEDKRISSCAYFALQYMLQTFRGP